MKTELDSASVETEQTTRHFNKYKLSSYGYEPTLTVRSSFVVVWFDHHGPVEDLQFQTKRERAIGVILGTK